MIFRARSFEFSFPRPAMVMGVVNVTPDSFSDGGQFFSPKDAIAHALELIAEGADLLDIGGESTRPNAVPVSEDEELRRVLPIVKELIQVSQVPVPLSIDTMKPGVARAAIEAGASIVNDVASAHRGDGAVWSSALRRSGSADGARLKAEHQTDEMWDAVRESGAGYVVMHMQGTPQTMQQHPSYNDVVAEVGDFFEERLNCLREHGVPPERTILDPGIGFGKTVEHNLELLAGLKRFRIRQRPLLVGASRKGFIGQITGARDAAERLPGSLVCACAAVEAGVEIIRTHDVAATRQALRMMEAIRARKK